MGFSVTATHVIFLVAMLGVGATATTAYWTVQERLDDGQRTRDALAEERVWTNLTVTSTSYDSGAQRYTVDVKNVGSTSLRVSELTYLIDGAVSLLVESTAVEGDSSTDLWLPGETLVVEFNPIASQPSFFRLVAGNGASTSYTE